MHLPLRDRLQKAFAAYGMDLCFPFICKNELVTVISLDGGVMSRLAMPIDRFILDQKKRFLEAEKEHQAAKEDARHVEAQYQEDLARMLALVSGQGTFTLNGRRHPVVTTDDELLDKVAKEMRTSSLRSS